MAANLIVKNLENWFQLLIQFRISTYKLIIIDTLLKSLPLVIIGFNGCQSANDNKKNTVLLANRNGLQETYSKILHFHCCVVPRLGCLGCREYKLYQYLYPLTVPGLEFEGIVLVKCSRHRTKQPYISDWRHC